MERKLEGGEIWNISEAKNRIERSKREAAGLEEGKTCDI